jgi:hypothetical protein
MGLLKSSLIAIANVCDVTGGALRAIQALDWFLVVFRDVYVLVNLTSTS